MTIAQFLHRPDFTKKGGPSNNIRATQKYCETGQLHDFYCPASAKESNTIKAN